MPKAKPASREKCAELSLTRAVTTYPVWLSGPGKLAGWFIRLGFDRLSSFKYEVYAQGYLTGIYNLEADKVKLAGPD